MKKTVKNRAKKPIKKSAKKTAKRQPKKTVKAPVIKRPVKTARPPRFSLSRAEVKNAARLLAQMRETITRTIEEKKKLDLPEAEVGDSIDQAYQSLEKEILFEFSDNEMANLGDIEAALRKTENGTYGVCEHCQSSIEQKRMRAMPAARYCLACQTGSEKQRVR